MQLHSKWVGMLMLQRWESRTWAKLSVSRCFEASPWEMMSSLPKEPQLVAMRRLMSWRWELRTWAKMFVPLWFEISLS